MFVAFGLVIPVASNILARLHSSLNTSKIATTNNPLYQTINGLINGLEQSLDSIEGIIKALGGSVTNFQTIITQIIAGTFLTATNEATQFPNSRHLLAGTNVTFDDTVPNQRTINVTAGTGTVTTTGTPAAGELTKFSGPTSITNGDLSGDVTTAGALATTIANDAVTNAKAANMAQSTIKGRAAGAGTGDPQDLTGTQVAVIVDAMIGDSGAGGTKGEVPAPAAGDTAAGKFLKADATWAVPSGTGITQLTGDVTAGPGSGSQVATIANDAVTYAKMQNISAASKILGRGSAAGSGDPQELAPDGTTIQIVGTTISAITGSGGTGNSTNTGAEGSEPGSPATGDLYLVNNGVYIRRYSGSAWTPWGPLFPMTEPVDGDYTWINQGGASVDTTNGGIYLLGPKNASQSARIRKKSAPSTPYTITAAYLGASSIVNFQDVGILFRESSGGKLTLFRNTNERVYVTTASSPTAYVANVATKEWWHPMPLFWQIANDGTKLYYRVSWDGQHFIEIYNEAKNTYFTTGPDEVGFFVQDQSNVLDVGMNLIHWKQT